MTHLDACGDTPRTDEPPSECAELRTRSEGEEDRSCHRLGEALAGAGLLNALADQALVRHGVKGQCFTVVATRDRYQRLGGVAVMGKLGDPSCRELLRHLADKPDPLMRLAVASSLYRCDERDSELWSSWILREDDLFVFEFLSVVAGCISLTDGTLDHLEAYANHAGTLAQVRASAAWAVAQHDVARGTALANTLLADPDAAFALSSVVRRRGGPLAPLVADVPGDPETDETADSLGLPRPAMS